MAHKWRFLDGSERLIFDHRPNWRAYDLAGYHMNVVASGHYVDGCGCFRSRRYGMFRPHIPITDGEWPCIDSQTRRFAEEFFEGFPEYSFQTRGTPTLSYVLMGYNYNDRVLIELLSNWSRQKPAEFTAVAETTDSQSSSHVSAQPSDATPRGAKRRLDLDDPAVADDAEPTELDDSESAVAAIYSLDASDSETSE